MVEVYRSVGKILQRYTTGKVPKAFKIIPNLSNWEDVLYLTAPEQWSPHAVYQATRLFASNLNHKMAQRFYALVQTRLCRAGRPAHGPRGCPPVRTDDPEAALPCRCCCRASVKTSPTTDDSTLPSTWR